MEGKRRDEEDPRQPGGAGGHDSKIVLSSSCHFCSFCFNDLSSKKKLNNHIIEIYKTPTSCIIQLLPRHHITCHLPTCPVCQNSVTTVARTFQESPSCQNTCWWSMKPAVPQKYCKTCKKNCKTWIGLDWSGLRLWIILSRECSVVPFNHLSTCKCRLS